MAIQLENIFIQEKVPWGRQVLVGTREKVCGSSYTVTVCVQNSNLTSLQTKKRWRRGNYEMKKKTKKMIRRRLSGKCFWGICIWSLCVQKISRFNDIENKNKGTACCFTYSIWMFFNITICTFVISKDDVAIQIEIINQKFNQKVMPSRYITFTINDLIKKII